MPFPTDTFLQFFRNSSNYVAQEFENFYAQLEGYLRKEHDENGSHADITVDSITMRPDGAIIFTLTNGTERGRIVVSGGQISVVGAPFYMLGGAVASDSLFITASGTTAGVNRGDVTLLGSQARLVEANHADGAGHWTTYTPSFTASTPPTNYSASGTYTRVGDTIEGEGLIVASASWTAGTGSYTFGLPVTGVALGATARPIGTAVIYDASTGFFYRGIVVKASTTTAQIIAADGAGAMSGAAPLALVTGDQIGFSFRYEAA